MAHFSHYPLQSAIYSALTGNSTPMSLFALVFQAFDSLAFNSMAFDHKICEVAPRAQLHALQNQFPD